MISKRARAFTLVELMVVVLIVVLLSAAVLPTVIPAIQHRQVSEAARILQAGLVGAKDAAIRAQEPRGIRLLLDPLFDNPGSVLAANRFIAIEPGPDYFNGRATINPFIPPPSGPPTPQSDAWPPAYPVTGNPNNAGPPTATYPVYSVPGAGNVLMIEEAMFDGSNFPNEPASWFWNIRVGDKIRLNDSGSYYTVVGPMTITPTADLRQGPSAGTSPGNPDLFVNAGPSGATSPLTRPDPRNPANVIHPQFLFVVNGAHDQFPTPPPPSPQPPGSPPFVYPYWVDPGWDGVDNDFNGIVDDVGEWEAETFLGTSTPVNSVYNIRRRPVQSQGARETTLPSDVVIDLTTWDTTRERSRLPFNQNTKSVDILINPSGQVVFTTIYSTPAASTMDNAYYHFWLAERADVAEPIDQRPSGVAYLLPMPEGTPNYPSPKATGQPRQLKGERRLVTLFARTGLVTTNVVEFFDGSNINTPFYDSQLGAREAK